MNFFSGINFENLFCIYSINAERCAAKDIGIIMTDQWFYIQRWARQRAERAEKQVLKQGEVEDGNAGNGYREQHVDGKEHVNEDTRTIRGEEGSTELPVPQDSIR